MLTGDMYVASMGKRLGEEWFFSGAFVFSLHFCYFSCVLFGGIENFCIFASGKGSSNNLSPRVYKCE